VSSLLSIPREISLETAGHEGRERGAVIGLMIDMKAVEEVEAHAVKDAAKVSLAARCTIALENVSETCSEVTVLNSRKYSNKSPTWQPGKSKTKSVS